MSNSKIRRAEKVRKQNEKPAPIVHKHLELVRIGFIETGRGAGRILYLRRDLNDLWSVTA
jgi:hypothetical protein